MRVPWQTTDDKCAELLPPVQDVLSYLRAEYVGEFYAKERTVSARGVHPIALHKISVDDEKLLGLSYAPTLSGTTVVDVLEGRGVGKMFPRHVARFVFSTTDLWDDNAVTGKVETRDFTLLPPKTLARLLDIPEGK